MPVLGKHTCVLTQTSVYLHKGSMDVQKLTMRPLGQREEVLPSRLSSRGVLPHTLVTCLSKYKTH